MTSDIQGQKIYVFKKNTVKRVSTRFSDIKIILIDLIIVHK